MDTSATTTIMKMLETVPDQFQETVVEHIRDYIEDIRDEAKWKNSFSRTQNDLISAAHQARQEIAEGKSNPMDTERL